MTIAMGCRLLMIPFVLAMGLVAHAGVVENTAYLGNIAKQVCDNDSQNKKQCTEFADGYFLKRQIPSSDGPALLSYETGFAAALCLAYDEADMSYLDANNCFHRVGRLSKFEKTQAAVAACQGKDDSVGRDCLGDQFMIVHNTAEVQAQQAQKQPIQKQQTVSCEAKLAWLQGQLGQLDGKASNVKTLKSGVDQIIQQLSKDPAPSAGKAN
jgi:hypothetical protein